MNRAVVVVVVELTIRTVVPPGWTRERDCEFPRHLLQLLERLEINRVSHHKPAAAAAVIAVFGSVCVSL